MSSEPVRASQTGILFASGVVAGEALVGVGVAMLIGFGIEGPKLSLQWSGTLSLIAAITIVAVFAAACRPRAST
jgi:hypothetical protein